MKIVVNSNEQPLHWRKVKKIKELLQNDKKADVEGTCYFCGEKVDGGDWCYGCHYFICRKCDNEIPSGLHYVEEHGRLQNDTG